MTQIEIHPTTTEDLPELRRVVDDTGLFPGDMLAEMIAPTLNSAAPDIWLTAKHDEVAVGLCFARPEEMADRAWNMLALAVLPSLQGKGIGRKLVTELETRLRQSGQRLLIVDTSGTDAFTSTRAFYAACDYALAATLPDYWEDGDDRVTFTKRL